MSLPTLPAFDELCRGLTLVREAGLLEYEIASARPAQQEGVPELHSPITLWYPRLEVPISALVRVVEQELRAQHHPANREIAESLLSIVALDPELRRNGIRTLRSFLKQLTLADVSQFYVLHEPLFSLLPEFAVGTFRIGRLDASRLEYRCRKAGSDFFARYGARLLGRCTIERAVRSVRVFCFPWLEARLRRTSAMSPAFVASYYQLLLTYFERVSQAFLDEFWTALSEEQQVIAATGTPWLDPRLVQEVRQHETISVYLNIEGRGYVVPTVGTRVPVLNLSMSNEIPRSEATLRQDYGFEGFTPAPVHQSLRTFTRFVLKAQYLRTREMIAESFLHYIIALDLLLGEEGKSTTSIADRAALIAHQALKQDYETCRRTIKKLYDRRSKYVHEGTDLPPELLETAAEICTSVTYCLLRLQKNQQPAWQKTWLAQLDLLIAQHQAHSPWTTDTLKTAGIIKRLGYVTASNPPSCIADPNGGARRNFQDSCE